MTITAIGKGRAVAPCRPWGTVVLQHQHAFMANEKCEVAHVARRALCALVAKDGITTQAPETQPWDPMTRLTPRLRRVISPTALWSCPKALNTRLARWY